MQAFAKAGLAALAITAALPALAGSDGAVARVDFLPGWRAADGRHMAALRVEMAPGWHTYWRAPGEVGIPPQFDFAGSDNLLGVTIHWPVPQVIRSNGYASVGYMDYLILPMEFELAQDDAPAFLEASISIGVCEEICVPFNADVRAALPATSGRHDMRIEAALADRPLSAAEAQAGSMDCDLGPADDGITLNTSLQLPSVGGAEFAVVELGNADLWVSTADVARQGGRFTASVDVSSLDGGAVAFDRAGVRLTVLGQNGAVEIAGCG